jgi:hypothetical protein
MYPMPRARSSTSKAPSSTQIPIRFALISVHSGLKPPLPAT